jgi:uncharacterized protein YjbI with pentapeptide repeats
MDLKNIIEKLNVDDADLARSTFDNTNLSSSTFNDCNMAEVQISDCRLTGSTINGIPVSDLLAAYQSLGKNGK